MLYAMNTEIRRLELTETEACGNSNPLNRRHYVNNRPVSFEQYDELKRAARKAGTLQDNGGSRACGMQSFYYCATLPLPTSEPVKQSPQALPR